MPLYLDQQNVGSAFNVLQDFAPTSGESFRATVGETWEQNPTVLGFEGGRVAIANARGQRLTAYDAAAVAKAAGDSAFAPGEAEYTREALDMVLERRREQRQRQDVIASTPWSWTGTPVRGLGMLAASVLDPLNVGSAFVPVVGEARYLALLKGAAGAGGRAAVRAGVGAVEGAAGMAMLEPLVYGAHAYLDDDYTMRDSLLNVAFGGFLGGGLHVVAGRVGDALAPGKWDRVRTLDEAHAQPDLPQPRADTGEPSPGSASEAALRAGPEAREDALRVSVGQMAEGKRPEVEAMLRAREAEEYRSWLTGSKVVDEQGAPLTVYHGTRADIAEFEHGHVGRKDEGFLGEGFYFTSDPQIASDYVHLKGPPGGGREDAPNVMPVQLSIKNPYYATADEKQRIMLMRDPERRASAAAEFTTKLRNEGHDGVILHYAHNENGRRPTEYVIFDSSQVRSAIGGRALTHDAENALPAARAAAARQAAPESSITGDFAAAKAADERLAAAPKSDDAVAATKLADDAVERVRSALADMKAAGAPAKVLEQYEAMLKEADQVVADAEALGKAVEAAAVCGSARA